jgi:hypothetical protein
MASVGWVYFQAATYAGRWMELPDIFSTGWWKNQAIEASLRMHAATRQTCPAALVYPRKSAQSDLIRFYCLAFSSLVPASPA